MAPGIDRQQ